MGGRGSDARPLAVVPASSARPGARRLFDAMTGRRICLVVGAAGWGKTTAVTAWARDRCALWMRCADDDVDARALVAGLVREINTHLPPPGIPLPAPGPGAAREVCERLRTTPGDEIVLVIDDLHACAPGDDLCAVVETLVRHGPERLRLVLVSRRDLPFSLVRLRGRGQVAEIHAPDLALTTADIDALLRESIGAWPPELADRIRQCTGGWPAAAVAAVELLRGVDVDERLPALARLSRPGERLHTYLAEEVLGPEPDGVRHVLRSLAVCGEAGPDATLVELARRGLVLRGAGDDAPWRVVPPLHDYLDRDPTLTDADRALLRAAAARACAVRGDHAAALRHLGAGGDPAAVAALLVEHGESLVRRGEVDAVLEVARRPDHRPPDPRIERVRGQALAVRGRWTEAASCFGRAADAHDPATAWRAAALAVARGELTAAATVCGAARTGDPATADDVQLMALAATVSRLTGDLDGAREQLVAAQAALRETADPAAHTSVRTAQAMLAAAGGDRLGADAGWAAALESAESAGHVLDAAWVRCLRAEFLVDTGAPRPAAADAEIAAGVAATCDSPFLTARATTVLAAASLRLGQLGPAQRCAEHAVGILRDLGSRAAARPLCALGDVHRVRGRPTLARAAYEEAVALAEPVGDVLGAGAALAGLARVRAAEDPDVAGSLAQRAAGAHADGQLEVGAVLTRGWVALLAGDRDTASGAALAAGAAARLRCDAPGAAEAMALTALSDADGHARQRLLAEAAEIYAEHGCVLEEAAATVLAARTGTGTGSAATLAAARRVLDAAGVAAGPQRAAGLLATAVHSAPALVIRALGSFQVIRDGVPVPRTAWQSKKARDLLKILVARRRPVPRERLMELLWPDVEPARAGNRLSVLLTMLRDALAVTRGSGEPVVTDGGAIGLDLDRVQVDVEGFLADADDALAAHRTGRADSVERLSATVRAYTGDFLEDDPYADWARPLAEELRATHVALLQALTVQLRRAGDVDGVVRYTLRLLVQGPYDEAAHRRLVEVLVAAGRLGEAHRHHGHYRRRMAEIGVDPAPVAGLPDVPGHLRARPVRPVAGRLEAR